MKLCAEKIAEAEAWVERNGLHPQRCGSTIKEFCEAMGITERTWTNWQKNSAFSEAITRAREKFTATTVKEVENALIKAARGAEYSITTQVAQRNKDGQVEVVKATTKTFHEAPNIEAAKFVLTNIKGEDWKLKQEMEHKGLPERVVVVRSEEEAAKLRKLSEAGI